MAEKKKKTVAKKKTTSKKKKKSILNSKGFKYTRIVLFLVILIISIILGYTLTASNYLPGKYVFILIDILVVLNVIIGMMLLTKKRVLNIIAIILVVLCSTLFITGDAYFNNIVGSIKNIISNVMYTTDYYFVVPASSGINDYKELDGTTIGILENGSENLIKELKDKKINVQTKTYLSMGDLVYALELREVSAILISDSMYELMVSEYENFDQIGRKLDFSLTVKGKIKAQEASIEKGQSFIVYISGVDNRDTKNVGTTGLSDVNILAVINPNAHKILLVNTPRDYYVKLHGAGEKDLKDKLTHAGLYGIDMSINTLQDLYGVHINAYAKFNFKAVTTLVDKIGGISVYSDTAFRSYHMPSWYVKKGVNNMNGAKALAYARERYAYSSGDRHRGKNQEDVISAIIKKITTNKKYLLDFPSLLSSIDNYFATNISEDTIQDLVKEQLDDMPSWQVESISVNGSNGQNRTYSWPKQVTYVMYPTQSTIDTAKVKIAETLRAK